MKERGEGLANLKHVLRNNNRFDVLSDVSFHRIYEVLFRVTLLEQSNYLKAKSVTLRSAAEARLSACGNNLRLSVEVGVRHIKRKTLRSVLDHIIETLPLSNGKLCEPIALDYAKCLRALLSYQPHVEHLSQQERERAALFCVDCMKNAEFEADDDDTAPGAELISTSGTINGLSYRSSRSHYKDSGGSQDSRSLARKVAVETVACLTLLIAAPNAATGRASSTLLWALVDFLKKTTASSTSHQDAFAAINCILSWTRTEDIALTTKATSPIVRLIRFYWTVKTPPNKSKTVFTLKDEMLVTCIYLRPYFLSIMQEHHDPTLRSELSGLLEVMRNDYCRRLERDQMQMDNLRLVFGDADLHNTSNIATAVFRLRCINTRVEANYTTVHMLASLCNVLSSQKREDASSEDENEEEINPRPRKRQRLVDEFDEVFKDMEGGSVSSRICALQTLAFLAQLKVFSSKQLAKVIDKLSASCAEDNNTISSWAFLALASCASQTASTLLQLSGNWTSIWQVATRAMSNASACRPACHLLQLLLALKLVPQQSVSEYVQTITSSIDLNGPSTLADSVLHLLAEIVKIAQQTNPTTSSATAESLLSWLFRNFRPSRFEDKAYASQHILFEPGDVVDLVACCLGQHNHGPTSPQFPIWDSIAQVWLTCNEQQALIEYLLLLPKPPSVTHKSSKLFRRTSRSSSQSRVSGEPIVLNHLISELHRTQEAWTQVTYEKPQSISLDVFSSFCTACCTATCLAYCNTFRDSRRQTQLQRQARDLLKLLAGFIPSRDCAQDKVDAMLKTFSCVCTGLLKPDADINRSECEKIICKTVSAGLESRKQDRDLNGHDDDDDAMDLDGNYNSQDSRRDSQSIDNLELKNELAVRFSKFSLRSSMALYATVVNSLEKQTQENDSIASSSTSVVDYILSLSEPSILASRYVISGLSDLGVNLTVEDSDRLLDYCTQEVLQAYPYERSEVATGAVLDIMSSTVGTWTNPSNPALFELGSDAYRWYATTALSGGVLSPNVQKRMATLLLQLCHIDTDYGHEDNVPSVRTSLFKLLQIGSITVQFDLANRISTIFNLFVLANHSAMFDDLQSSLPADSECIEGMAMRLLFLAKLASAWHSLLRQCVYYIFETAGRVKSAVKHATRSVAELAMSLRFESPQKLFRLFAPQLLHTWLESHTVTSLPFSIFQYDSLNTLIAHNQAEIIAQLLVRGNDEGMQAVWTALDAKASGLVTRSFAKCEAYSICWDISKPPTSGNEDSSETRLRRVIGNKDEWKALVTDRFAAIMGQFYLSVVLEDVEDKWLEKKNDYRFAAKALAEMRTFSHSDRELPGTQQPSFKSKYLCDQIERLCRRTSQDPLRPWEPSSFTLAVRMLLDSVEDALGPLHTCMVVRKLRLLISMAGDVAISGFPLEMLIHTLRPFLSDSQCADDVIGVLQYLFHHGEQYLRTTLPFLYGTVTLLVLQMRKHSVGRQESTTQESQHMTTVHKMRMFQAWLVKYLERCQPTDGSTEGNSYHRFAKALSQVDLPGNAYKGSPESSLLLLLLDQKNTDTALVRESDRDEALVFLSESFAIPSSVDEDCLEDDQRCAYFAQNMWRTLEIPSLSDSFVAWAASVLGRAYASTGKRPRHQYYETRQLLQSDSKQYEGIAKSQVAIARRLSKTLFSRGRIEASVADFTLRRIVHSFRDAEEAIAFEQMLPSSIVPAIVGGTFGYEPPLDVGNTFEHANAQSLRHLLEPSSNSPLETWVQNLSLKLCRNAADVAILPALTTALQYKADLALDLFPCIVHILLARELEKEPALRTELSTSVAAHLSDNDDVFRPKQRYLLELLLFLRSQPLPGERTHADRLRWLEVDWLAAAQAANACGMPTTALLCAESASQPANGNRRTSSRASLSQVSQVSMAHVPQDLLLSVFKAVEEPDSFYGVEQPASLDSVLDRLDYEADGFRSLMFRSAQTDTHLRHSHRLNPRDTVGMVHSLALLNLDSLTFALLSGGLGTIDSSEDLLKSARRLQQWDIVPSEGVSHVVSSSFVAFQELSRANEREAVEWKIQNVTVAHTRSMIAFARAHIPRHEWFSVLSSLVETREMLSSTNQNSIRSTWKKMQARQSWMQMARFDDFRSILSNRHTLFSVQAQNTALSKAMGVGMKDIRGIEVESLLDMSRFAREHGQLQEALVATNQVGDLIRQGKSHGLKADAAARFETALVLWDSGESTASVRMLRDALEVPAFDSQDIPVGRSGLLAQLAHQLAEARLEKPDDVLTNYLKPAINHLQGRSEGQEAGKVYYEFASFCDKQLQSSGNIEDFNRIAKLRQRKLEEVEELERLSKTAKKSGTEKHDYTRDINKSKQWFQMDDDDYQRLKRSRDTFMQQSLQNYMLALRASDEHDISILRFFALWLENSEVPTANAIVNKHLQNVPSWKFVVLMNQLMSRLEHDKSAFQASLRALASRICSEHPHHSLHHLFATTRKPSGKDQAAQSRYEVGTIIRKHLTSIPRIADLLKNVFLANNQYNMLAFAETDNIKSSQIGLKDLSVAASVATKVPDFRVPPPTIHLALRRDKDYSSVPVVTKFSSIVRIMSGLSHPKKLTAYASDGQQYAMLFKSGNDDLRQDAIMEQVFDEVSKMLRNHKPTRQRNLHVRTYKVIPLSPRSGIIEFVANSTSFSDFLVSAHERYHPQDYKNNTARGKIGAVKEHSIETRIKEYRKVCEHMQPVMRHFFFERYNDPDEWFEKRTAYTRTTATVSILGHVLGLGDRHCQNIMLDEKTGEVVHIDLGVAFEAGKVLPVPELVPFRLTRDVIDGMGITKTEGVFRRCCEFTMDALREDKDSIMTLLNVLRYDPLYTWSVSPLRAKRMQEETGRNAGDADVPEGSKKKEQEAGEADRALSIVEKKLSKTLSTAATVNELIQQATDERNLATLFQGWAAYF